MVLSRKLTIVISKKWREMAFLQLPRLDSLAGSLHPLCRHGHRTRMPTQRSSWIRRRAEQAMRLGLERAYRTVGVNPDRYLRHLRRAYGLNIASFREMHTVPLPVVDYLAEKTIRASIKVATLEGAGVGFGGLISILPDVGMLGGITWRMIQKLSLLHGFEYASEDDVADLWLAAASAAGVDLGKDVIRKQVIERFVPRIIERIAVQAGGEIAENALCRVVPIMGSVVGGALNYHFVRAWGRRAQRHFRERHILLRNHRASLLPPGIRTITVQGH
jgi:hypothetical protein